MSWGGSLSLSKTFPLFRKREHRRHLTGGARGGIEKTQRHSDRAGCSASFTLWLGRKRRLPCPVCYGGQSQVSCVKHLEVVDPATRKRIKLSKLNSCKSTQRKNFQIKFFYNKKAVPQKNFKFKAHCKHTTIPSLATDGNTERVKAQWNRNKPSLVVGRYVCLGHTIFRQLQNRSFSDNSTKSDKHAVAYPLGEHSTCCAHILTHSNSDGKRASYNFLLYGHNHLQ